LKKNSLEKKNKKKKKIEEKLGQPLGNARKPLISGNFWR
jgi:hypothetical protein